MKIFFLMPKNCFAVRMEWVKTPGAKIGETCSNQPTELYPSLPPHLDASLLQLHRRRVVVAGRAVEDDLVAVLLEDLHLPRLDLLVDKEADGGEALGPPQVLVGDAALGGHLDRVAGFLDDNGGKETVQSRDRFFWIEKISLAVSTS